MKKTYMKPELEVLNVKCAQMIAASLPVYDTEEVNSGDVLSRDGELLFDEGLPF
jgi:hypothetical protein